LCARLAPLLLLLLLLVLLYTAIIAACPPPLPPTADLLMRLPMLVGPAVAPLRPLLPLLLDTVDATRYM
jgi:hypothetical protein